MFFPSSSGNKKPSAAVAAAASSGSPSSGDPTTDAISGKFDPTALERGAQALKELDSSPNATKAFEVIKLQEQSKQKEFQTEIERAQTQRTQMGLQRAQVEAEEKRKTIAEQQDQERRTQQYKAQLESELYQKKLIDQQKQNEDWLAQQHQQFLRQEEIRKKNDVEVEESRRRTLIEQMKLQRDNDVARAQAEADGRIKQERENVDVHLRSMRAKAAEERKTKLDTINATLGSLGSGFRALLDDKTKMTALVTGLTAVALGIYTAKAGTRVAGNLLEKRLGKPPLVRETSRKSWSRALGLGRPASTNMLEKIVLQDELAERLQWTTNSIINAKKNGTPFRHLMLYGPPGTGKTLFARTLALQSGLDYAIMTGGDVGPLGKDAVDEMNRLFAWANSSKKGLILFIDEADAFLRRGRMSSSSNMSEDARNVLSAFLAHTGTENDKFMVVLATNVREVLDRAVLDRVDEQFEFPLPEFEQRRQMLDLFMDEYIRQPTKAGKVIEVDPAIDSAYLDEVARRTEGFSGRQMSKLVLAYQASVFGSGANKLTKGLADTILNWKLAHYEGDVDTMQRHEAEELKAKAQQMVE
ncbi:26S proteosome regulatory subunit, putative [Perkinsus marinus ATCC 50983]|uniref:26S proteosome regulatory subunit, putative n=1 Tax=Perkinsus marinus (strain ATCC 50983 / TXsc) TaxID=423536 RepID=C5KRS4_PERM5|nr:26S proteosome regulatory subunit, putative [Perkinsus marinus ATCC 50983]EER12765.1 26S proteosome regulatory subunit, putative [Perkinsus marinus ATCC 50983]|eukprot:XP_002780970.1 26S proteosome regulatory subunit, putative [Perkinsus marinus ATCC 50983]